MQSDVELLERWRSGEGTAGNELFHRHFGAVHRFFVNKVDQDAEDLIQLTFMRMTEARERFAGHSSFRTYLFAIAHNVLREYFRERRRVEPITFDSRSVFELGSGLSSVIAKKQDQQLLLDGLRRIPIAFQILLELYYWEQLTGPELAEVLELPENTVRSRIRRGRELLGQMVGRRRTEPVDDSTEDFDAWAKEVRALFHLVPPER